MNADKLSWIVIVAIIMVFSFKMFKISDNENYERHMEIVEVRETYHNLEQRVGSPDAKVEKIEAKLEFVDKDIDKLNAEIEQDNSNLSYEAYREYRNSPFNTHSYEQYCHLIGIGLQRKQWELDDLIKKRNGYEQQHDILLADLKSAKSNAIEEKTIYENKYAKELDPSFDADKNETHKFMIFWGMMGFCSIFILMRICPPFKWFVYGVIGILLFQSFTNKR